MAIAADFTKYFDSIEGLDEETKKMFLQETIEKELHINVTMDFVEEATTEKWKTELIQAAGGENLQVEVNTVIKSSTDYEAMVESIRKMYKDAKTIVSDLSPVLVKVGLTADGKTEIGVHGDTMSLDAETQKALEGFLKRYF